jgi:hypothetical protein
MSETVCVLGILALVAFFAGDPSFHDVMIQRMSAPACAVEAAL